MGKKRTRDEEPEVELHKKDKKKSKKDKKDKKDKKAKKAKKEDDAVVEEKVQMSEEAEMLQMRVEKFKKKLAKTPHDLRIKNKLTALEEELAAELAKPQEARPPAAADEDVAEDEEQETKQPPAEISETVFVGGLPFNVDEETLLQVFHDCGEVQAVRFGHDADGEFKRYAHVDFDSVENAKKALDKAGEKVLNKKIRVEPAARGAGAAVDAAGANAPDADKAKRGKTKKKDAAAATAKPFVAPEAPEANPENVNRCFVGNLPFGIDETTMNAAFEAHQIQPSYVNFVTDRETGNFYGSSFVVFNTAEDAAWAVAYSNAGFCIQDRPIRIEYCPHRNKSKSGAGAASRPTRPPSKRPEGGTKAVFFGNLSFDLDPSGDQVHEFCKPFGPIKALRWIEDKETGQFKGAAFADFFTEDVVDQVVEKLNGKKLLGRPVRVDYA